MEILKHSDNFWESTDTKDLDGSMVKFNSEFTAIHTDETIAVPGRPARKFASLDATMKTIRPILAKHGLYIMQPITGDTITTIIKHSSGQFRAFMMPMVAWQGQGTTAIQNLGGAITYMRRYALGAALALAIEEDDDANSTGKLDINKQTKQAAKPDPKTQLAENVIDAWQSKVNECKEPADFTKLSEELSKIDSEPVKAFTRTAMATRMKDVRVKFDKDVTNTFMWVDPAKNAAS